MSNAPVLSLDCSVPNSSVDNGREIQRLVENLSVDDNQACQLPKILAICLVNIIRIATYTYLYQTFLKRRRTFQSDKIGKDKSSFTMDSKYTLPKVSPKFN